LKLKCDEWLSDFAFNFNLCRYIKVRTLSSEPLVMVVDDVFRPDTARRCRLTPSNPR
jgi:predicted ATPase